MTRERPSVVRTADFDALPTINGDLFPYYIHTDGPLIEAIDEHVHILWMPLLAEGPAPRLGPPVNAEPLSTKETR